MKEDVQRSKASRYKIVVFYPLLDVLGDARSPAFTVLFWKTDAQLGWVTLAGHGVAALHLVTRIESREQSGAEQPI